jgi:hypothetical protein
VKARAEPVHFASIAFAALAAVLPVCQAQSLYRCGNTYSQVPCAAAASAVRIAPAAAPDPAPGLQGKELCSALVPRLVRLDDPGSVRIESVVKGDAEVIQYAGQAIATRKYILSVNLANAHGAYVGARPYACFLSEDERRILQVSPVR